ncbi:unnamed protein product [Rotaria sp. Silwood2]|nr:unnamed protein product [Rotaria sp. Silwood2]
MEDKTLNILNDFHYSSLNDPFCFDNNNNNNNNTSIMITNLDDILIDDNENTNNNFLNTTNCRRPIQGDILYEVEHENSFSDHTYDFDLTQNNIQYNNLLENNNTEFRFINQLPPSIIIIEKLDRELKEKYYFNYCAYDGIYEEQRSCCIKVIIIITDINDNSLQFQHNQQLPLIINVSEYTSIHTELIQMKAVDSDEGLNGQIIYSFSKWTLNDKTINDLFYINPSNGSIILLKQLDYEQRNNYELQIEAVDLGPNAIPTYVNAFFYR